MQQGDDFFQADLTTAPIPPSRSETTPPALIAAGTNVQDMSVFADSCRSTSMKSFWNSRCILVKAFALALMPWAAHALDPSKDLSQYRCKTWTGDNELPAEVITSVAQAKNGLLWLGSQNGLISFDGIDFRTVSLPREPEFRKQSIMHGGLLKRRAMVRHRRRWCWLLWSRREVFRAAWSVGNSVDELSRHIRG